MEMLKGKGETIVENAPRSVQSDMPVQYRWKKSPRWKFMVSS